LYSCYSGCVGCWCWLLVLVVGCWLLVLVVGVVGSGSVGVSVVVGVAATVLVGGSVPSPVHEVGRPSFHEVGRTPAVGQVRRLRQTPRRVLWPESVGRGGGLRQKEARNCWRRCRYGTQLRGGAFKTVMDVL
jgi:hypothetical protein